MPLNIAQKLIKSHLVEGSMNAGEPISLRIDQTLTQDATGTMVMLELEAMKLDHVKTELSAQYVDHNLLQTDSKNADDHLFLHSACQKYGIWYSRPGNGVSHMVHMERFGIPGKSLLGSDSHTPAAGSMGMLAIGAGGLEVALAMAGEAYQTRMPKVLGVELTGSLPDWVSAKDVILEMLRRYDVDGGLGYIIEYYGSGLASLSAMDRHVIANMGAELGATTTVFPADEKVREFLVSNGRADDFQELLADEGADYDNHVSICLDDLVPLIACPSSPGNVVPVSEVSGKDIYQAYIGSSANPGLRDFGIAALMVDGRQVQPTVSFDINPTSRQILDQLMSSGLLGKLIESGARLHQAGCNGCIGMGQAPATGRISLRTTPRNFAGRSGTIEDQVYLCSPETATASALTGVITDPRELDFEYPEFQEPDNIVVNTRLLVEPPDDDKQRELVKGPNIVSLPDFSSLPDELTGPVMLKVDDDISTDAIMPAGSRVLPYRSNVPEISKFVFYQLDEGFYKRAIEHQKSGFYIIGGENYGQGSSREHAALAPRYLGLRAVIVKSFARIHRQNLANFGVLPLTFKNSEDFEKIKQGDELKLTRLRYTLEAGKTIKLTLPDDSEIELHHDLSDHEVQMVLQGSLINLARQKH